MLQKKYLVPLILMLVLLSSCGTSTGTGIARHPGPADFSKTPDSVPVYDPQSNDLWQMDLRSADLTKLDLSKSKDDLLYASFDSKTIWPTPDQMPDNFDWQRIMETAKSPGLGIRELHNKGITGKGVGIAIIDATLLVDHQEYVNQLKLYEETWEVQWLDSMSIHGAAVASIAVGKTVGVAPEADLYYFANENCYGKGGTDFECLSKIVRRVLEVNKQLPQEHKIRVLSMSIGWMPGDKGYDEITSAVEDAKADGIFVVNAVLENTYGFQLFGMGRDPLANPDDPSSYRPADWWLNNFYAGAVPEKMLLVPMDSRTMASPTGFSDYVYYRQGGTSWAIPYLAGTYALSVQVKPTITAEEFWKTALETGETIQMTYEGRDYAFGVILDPQALIAALQK
ncbi:MAG: S8/S53 family peptidase [Chloroflexi bacterium]|nr:S8/S53 family peptidase [Chloroflexota bacterium]